MIVPVDGEYEMADRSRDRCVRRTLRSVALIESVTSAVANVLAKSSWEKMREVFDVAVFEARSSTSFDAAYKPRQYFGTYVINVIHSPPCSP